MREVRSHPVEGIGKLRLARPARKKEDAAEPIALDCEDPGSRSLRLCRAPPRTCETESPGAYPYGCLGDRVVNAVSYDSSPWSDSTVLKLSAAVMVTALQQECCL